EAAGRAKEAAGRAKEAAEAMDGAHLGLTSWRKGEKAREKAETAWGKAEFRDATAGWNEARTAYAESEKAARAAKVEQGLEAARGAKKRGAGEAVVAAADGVLALDGGNAEAKKLKAEAEANLKPSILLTATLDGREVAATVTEGVARSGMKTPVAVNLERGGPYEFAAEYQAGGKTYAGRTTVQAKAKGVTEAAVALREVQAAEEGSRAGERMTVRVGSREVALRWCPAGSFMMGSPGGEEGRGNDEVQHRVTLTKGFWMGETEVTQGLWKEVMGGNPSCFKNGDGYPVENVSWTDCDQFVKTLNSRYGQPGMRWALPTEAQWEYACRAGSTTAYFWGNALNGDKANCNGNYPCGTTAKGPYKRKTTPVGSYAPNAWGMYDMHGNVWEWCAARYEPYPSSAVTDPTGAVSGSSRVYRGGSWYSDARSCRSAQRNGGDLGFRDYRLGLRVVLSPVQ
ncbi:MAG: SUMF1/EgtB/PvdO family nonheme iron enzyme, partial [Kiritimatiellae bacterium]|nr:SUMF1/EgtB/PvdO family nonheme iron enzyme [Kiritimatiellia bacterium]